MLCDWSDIFSLICLIHHLTVGAIFFLEKVFVQWEPPLIFPKHLQTVFDLNVLCNSLMHCHTVTWWHRKLPHICVSLYSFYCCEKSPDENTYLALLINNFIIHIDVLCDQSDIFSLMCLTHFTQSFSGVPQSITGLPNTRATKKLCAALSNQNIFSNII